MIISSPDIDKAYEDDVDFTTQREYLSRFSPSSNFFFDWLIAIYWELQGRCSPFEYATRICVAEKILDSTKLDHVMASQKVLLRVVRNLFPYDKLSDSVDDDLKILLGESRGKVKKPKFKPLQDIAARGDDMVSMRYNILASAFCGQAINLLKILRENIDDEDIPSYMNLARDALAAGEPDIDELVRLRKLFYLSFPEEELRSVADSTLRKCKDLKRSSDLPKDMEPEYMQQMLNKYVAMVHGRLQTIIMNAKDAISKVAARKQYYINQLNELLTMCTTVKSYVEEGDFEAVNRESEELIRYINKKFDLSYYLPQDVLSDIANDRILYKNGYL